METINESLLHFVFPSDRHAPAAITRTPTRAKIEPMKRMLKVPSSTHPILKPRPTFSVRLPYDIAEVKSDRLLLMRAVSFAGFILGRNTMKNIRNATILWAPNTIHAGSLTFFFFVSIFSTCLSSSFSLDISTL